jgi:hypothetical protein
VTSASPDDTNQPDLAIRCSENPAVRIRLCDRHFDGDYGDLHPFHMSGDYDTHMAIELIADGLRAQCDDILFSPWDRDDLINFLDGLAADFRGWTGHRTWRTNHLALEASFGSGGHVELNWTLLPALISPPWRATVTTTIEAGEQMSTLAADIRSFLTRPKPV